MKTLANFGIALCLTVCVINLSHGQTINELDKKFGFKDFRLGDPKAKWMPQLTLRSTGATNTYRYNGSCCREAFGAALKDIGVAFDRNEKLKNIFLIFRDRKQGEDLTRFFGTIEQAFGESTAQDANSSSGDITRQWAGKAVILTVYARYKGADEGGWEMHAVVATRESGSNADF